MQDAIIARQILQQQAGNRRSVTVASDAIRGVMWYATIGYDPEIEDVFSGEITDIFTDISDLGESVWSVHSGPYAITSVIPSGAFWDIAERSGGAPASITFDQFENEAGADYRKEQGEIYGRLEGAKSTLNTETYNRLKQRFDFLFEPEDGQQIRVSPGSVRQLLQFLRKDQNLHCPSIVITDRKYIKAIWQASESQIFWIEFEPNGDVTYLAFLPNERRSDGIERVSALSTVEDVLDRAQHIGAIEWMKR